MSLLATLFTMTTYGTWLRGDQRGWIDGGRIMLANPTLEMADERRLKYPKFLFEPGDLLQVGNFIGQELQARLGQRILALTVQAWHVHLIVARSEYQPPQIVMCAKDAVRYGLRLNRPIWTEGYDKRYCFDERATRQRIEYVERHNTMLGWSTRPWSFIVEG